MPVPPSRARRNLNRRGKQFLVLLDHEDRRALRRVADDMKLTLSDAVRILIRRGDSRLKDARTNRAATPS